MKSRTRVGKRGKKESRFRVFSGRIWRKEKKVKMHGDVNRDADGSFLVKKKEKWDGGCRSEDRERPRCRFRYRLQTECSFSSPLHPSLASEFKKCTSVKCCWIWSSIKKWGHYSYHRSLERNRSFLLSPLQSGSPASRSFESCAGWSGWFIVPLLVLKCKTSPWTFLCGQFTYQVPKVLILDHEFRDTLCPER